MKINEVQTNNVKNVPTSTTIMIDNSPVLSSKYPLLESLSIETSDLKKIPLRVIKLNNIMKELTCTLEDNEIEMNIVCWGRRGEKIIKILSSGHLRYDWFK